MKMTVWIVAANHAKARIFQYEGERAAPSFVLKLDHPEGRVHVGKLVTDRPGRSFGGSSPLRHALDRADDAHDHEGDVFARQLADRLREARRRERFDRLVLVCEPRFLGRLRESLDRETAKLVIAERAAGVMNLPPAEMAESFRGLVEPSHLIQAG